MSEEEKVVQESEEQKSEEKAAEQEELKNENGEAAQEEKKEASTEEVESHGEQSPEEKYEELNDKYLRLNAEYQNFRTRTAKEKTDIYAHANEEFAKGLLDVIDNFERAMAAKPEDDKFAEGMELILKQLLAVLDKNNVKEIEALGKPFDPNFHNAVMTEAAEGVESGTVLKVLQKGYVLNSKVIRPSMVSVAK